MKIPQTECSKPDRTVAGMFRNIVPGTQYVINKYCLNNRGWGRGESHKELSYPLEIVKSLITPFLNAWKYCQISTKEINGAIGLTILDLVCFNHLWMTPKVYDIKTTCFHPGTNFITCTSWLWYPGNYLLNELGNEQKSIHSSTQLWIFPISTHLSLIST